MIEAVDPSRYSVTESLRDGRRVEIRAVQPTDRPGLDGAVQRMSDESMYRRFFFPKRHFTEQEVAYYTDVDFVNHVSLVAVIEEDGRLADRRRLPLRGDRAGHRRGRVRRRRSASGLGPGDPAHRGTWPRSPVPPRLERFVAEVLAGNTAMLKVFEKSGLRASTRREHDVVHVTLALS